MPWRRSSPARWSTAEEVLEVVDPAWADRMAAYFGDVRARYQPVDPPEDL